MFIIRPARFLIAVLFLISATCIYGQKLKTEDVITKHLESLGAAEARGSSRSRVMVGEVVVNFITQKNAPLPGRLVLASAGEKSFMGMRFNSSDYPTEKFSFDGASSKVAFVRSGTRSILGNFVFYNKTILEESLLGGALFSSWALNNLANKKAKISLSGTRKIDGTEVYVLNYSPKGGSDVDIKLYFDKENFRHVRTEYKRVSSASIGTTPEASSRFSESRLTVVETFSDFKTENNLTLPHKYKLYYTITGQNGTTEIEWDFSLMEFAFNQNLAPDTFNAEAN